MIYTSKEIELDGKVYKATEVDFNSYDTENGQIELNSKTYYAHKKVGFEDDVSDNYRITQVLLDNNTYKYIFEKVETTGANIYNVSSIAFDGTQELQITGGVS